MISLKVATFVVYSINVTGRGRGTRAGDLSVDHVSASAVGCLEPALQRSQYRPKGLKKIPILDFGVMLTVVMVRSSPSATCNYHHVEFPRPIVTGQLTEKTRTLLELHRYVIVSTAERNKRLRCSSWGGHEDAGSMTGARNMGIWNIEA